MNARKSVLLAVFISVAATSVLWIVLGLAILEARRAVVRTHELSNIIAPMDMLIDDLNRTAEAERHDVLRRKLEALQEHWAAYRTGSQRPDGFCGAICKIGEESSQTTDKPSDGSDAARPQPFVVTLATGTQYRVTPDIVKLQDIPRFKVEDFESAVRAAVSRHAMQRPILDMREVVFAYFSMRVLDGPSPPPRYYKIGHYAQVELIQLGN